ncbi:outer membrane protein assembly factor BamE [Rhodobacteraceae bacterium KMM 6894]|nr:outer membrane protein assembly factor BamE [Rhodobacteraceae bacterium KMM 6894]
MFGTGFTLKSLLAVLGLALIVGCTATYRNHGYVPPDEDLQQLVVGVDTRATVDDVIGAPSASGLLGGGDYYYVRSRIKHYGMKRPEVIDRQVLVISFQGSDVIANIERFDLRDGNIVPLSRRVTNSSVADKGFLKQMMSNFGNLNPAEFF